MEYLYSEEEEVEFYKEGMGNQIRLKYKGAQKNRWVRYLFKSIRKIVAVNCVVK